MEQILREIQNSEKTYYTKAEIVHLIKSYIPKVSAKVESKGVTVDLDTYVVTYNGKQKRLPRKVVQLAHYFIANEGKTLKRDKILDAIWGDDVIVTDRTVDVHVRLIRKNLFNDCIETVKGLGYKW
jgi:two-component system alkaline phosphatase synthesis response regulator PhoP